MLQEAALLLDAPGLIDRARDRPEHSKRPPNERQQAADANLHSRGAESVELTRHEIKLGRKVSEHEVEDRHAVLLVRRDRTEQRDDEEQEGKQREECVV